MANFKLASGADSTTSASSSVSVDKMSLATTRTDTSESVAPGGLHLSTYEGGLVAVSHPMIAGLQTTSCSQSPEPEENCCEIPLVETPRDVPYLAGHTDLQRQHPATPHREFHTAGEDAYLPTAPSRYIGANFAAVDGYSPTTATLPAKVQAFARPSSTPQQQYSPIHLHTHQAHRMTRTSSTVAAQPASVAPTPYGFSRHAHWHAC
jgi:hypothetical protein